jgi:excinuclease ABC subunit C
MPALKRALRAQTSDAQLAVMRGSVREGAQDRPGVYRMLSPDGEVVYVGKSKRVRTRLLSYFRCAYPEDKGARILREATTIDWEYTPSEFAALLTELRLIKRLRPRFNVAMKRDARHYAFIKMSRGAAAKLMVVRGAGSEDGGVYYGPFVGAQRIGEAVRELSDALGLRDCSLDQRMYFADQAELFGTPVRTPGCIRHEVRKCLGPCIAACTVSAYAERVQMARAFLDGADDGPIERLREEMQAASDRMEFERAATLRDKLHRLEELQEQFGRLRFAVETLSFLYSVRGYDGDDRLYLIRRGRVRAEVPSPQSSGDRQSLEALVQSVYSPPERKTSSVPTHEIDELLLLSSWFRRNPAELDNTRSAEGVVVV